MNATIAPDGTIAYSAPATLRRIPRIVATIARDCGNRKVGRDTITTSRGQASCPTTCPLMGSGCYGENVASGSGRTLFDNVGRPNGKSLAGIVASVLSPRRRKAAPRAQRFNVVGDYLTGESTPDRAYIAETNQAADALRPVGTVSWSYTHAWEGYGLAPADFTYVVRASCSTVEEVRRAHAAGWYAAIVVPTAADTVDANGRPLQVDGRNMVVCPAISGAAESCADCRLCGRNAAVIAFPVHGGRAKRAAAAIRQAIGA